MNQKSHTTFVWYATHKKHGNLILAVPSKNAYLQGYVYSPRMISDRLGTSINALMAIELNLGPMGNIPRHLYEEAGVMIDIPPWLRALALMDERREHYGLGEDHIGNYDDQITSFILESWEKVYK